MAGLPADQAAGVRPVRKRMERRLMFADPNCRHTLVWRKSRASETPQSECVEVAHSSGFICIRDSRYPGGPLLWVAQAEWRMFIFQVKRGVFDARTAWVEHGSCPRQVRDEEVG
ncbi:DUF397 domain-containing protein [Sphaerisporangium corydalis]|uniref:DUF397 domain-containing protein n=1 Tax=Sphaerisporangium corydalis TaxID=1441875 RepID=A0ABV9ER19_9ACTN|nr:DUF397 domain-containing protein [Sphaerisporangium corydalis]